ncbi:MAG: hypothetical protein ACREVW_05235 [Burkholderiales bacterium]
MEKDGLDGLTPAEVSEAIVDGLFGRAVWERMYAKTEAMPLTEEDEEDLKLAMEIAAQRQALWASKR